MQDLVCSNRHVIILQLRTFISISFFPFMTFSDESFSSEPSLISPTVHGEPAREEPGRGGPLQSDEGTVYETGRAQRHGAPTQPSGSTLAR